MPKTHLSHQLRRHVLTSDATKTLLICHVLTSDATKTLFIVSCSTNIGLQQFSTFFDSAKGILDEHQKLNTLPQD